MQDDESVQETKEKDESLDIENSSKEIDKEIKFSFLKEKLKRNRKHYNGAKCGLNQRRVMNSQVNSYYLSWELSIISSRTRILSSIVSRRSFSKSTSSRYFIACPKSSPEAPAALR